MIALFPGDSALLLFLLVAGAFVGLGVLTDGLRMAMLTVAAFAVWVNAPTKEERGLTAEAKGGAIAARLRRLERLRQRNAAMLITNQ